jgi:aarF domain-containing kinase
MPLRLGSKRLLLGATTAGLSAYTFSDESLNRAVRFYGLAFPAYLHYELLDRFLTWQSADSIRREKAFSKLHSFYSPIMRDHVLRMRGFFLKAAQLMSTREDFVPSEYLEWTTKMQNEAPVTFSAEQAKAIVCEGLGIRSISDVFSEWINTPVGSASIGQVYKAKLRKNDEWVAVKVQAPNAEHQFKSDLRACKIFCQVALPHLVVSLEEIERQFLTEFDYKLEAENLREIHNNLITNGPWGSTVVVPKPYTDMCSKNVLVMDFIQGRKVSDIFSEYLNEIALKEKKSVGEIKTEFKNRILKEGLTNLGKRWWYFTFSRMYDWITGSRKKITVNVVDLLETAMKVHGHQIFVNGAFNGDPHPGNLILTDDGKLGLVDFGQVKRLGPQRLEQIARLIVALDDDRQEEIVSIALEMGSSNKYNIPEVIYRLTAFWFDRDTPDITQGLDIHKFLEEMERRDPQKVLCQDLVMVSRCSVMLRSLGLSLGLRARTTDYWRPYADEFLEKYNAGKFQK